jgi:predicted transcriptional regulator
MLTRLHVEHETQSMQITIENIAPRDAVSTELLMHDIANFLQAFSLYLKSGSDVSAETEHRFLLEIEELSKRLVESDALITSLCRDRSS